MSHGAEIEMRFAKSPVHSFAGIVVAALIATPAPAQDYYAGKTIEFIVGGDSGGGYDI
jgi:hypothetical protein